MFPRPIAHTCFQGIRWHNDVYFVALWTCKSCSSFANLQIPAMTRSLAIICHYINNHVFWHNNTHCIVVATWYWNKKQWNTNPITGTTHVNTHKTIKMQFQTSCFNFLRLTIGLCFACAYLFILVRIGFSLSTKRIKA
jgi:hypothetical protein